MDPPRINPPELFTRAHQRIASLSPTRSPTRQRITDDILADLSPATTLEAFTNPSGRLRASVEAATPSERSFGIRATIASKKIQEWVDELSTWPWPSEAGSAGFEVPAAKRRRVSTDERTARTGHREPSPGEEEYIGSLPAEEVARYENRIDDIHEDMEDLDVEEIKSTVLNTHLSPKSRPSSSGSNAPVPSSFSSYTRMDDFTAVVTATVLQALPTLSRLTRLLDFWTVRLLVLRKVPLLLHALDDAEVALKSGWQILETPWSDDNARNGQEDKVLDRKTFDIMRDVLQDRVTALGKELDYMLDTLEGREDTLPEVWLDRMENIERDYGEWVVQSDQKVREGEWSKMAKARKAEEDRIKAEAEAREAVRLQAEKEQIERDLRLRLEQEEAARLERERREAEEKLRREHEAAVEANRQAEISRELEEKEAERLELERKDAEEKLQAAQEATAEAARQAKIFRKLEGERIQAEEEASRQEAERLRVENERLLASEQEAAAEAARHAEVLRIQEEARIKAEQGLDIPRPASSSSDTSTVLNRQYGDALSSPLTPCCPLSPLAMPEFPPEIEDESPLKGRVRSRIDTPTDRSLSFSPPPIPSMSPRRSFHLPKPLSLGAAESESQDSRLTPMEVPDTPMFESLDISEASVWSSPKKSSDDHIQAQISSLLESIPARIRLTSEPDTAPSPLTGSLRPAKNRRSVTPSLRSHSSLGVRAATPSFTLAPAYARGTSRPRPQSGNPEIKLYHLSRSTGEAPIKLFVRLVGENGERVMVRVGGGWADLGEYLREYASHHGRRSVVDSDKVEVQDIRPRITSTSFTASTSATTRGNGRSSPTSRPGSALDRPMSSLHIRRTRRSVGETESSAMNIRTPSTPIPMATAMANRTREFETPPSEKARSSSRLSWTEEDGGLGLAGPKAKKVAISERDEKWVESMKEKVRLASAEKEKKEAGLKDRKSFGEMDRVGGTKRLFKKG
ncbi:hypothetical protein D0Z07_5232 [Hyphodiscus hymeniophilus]|uniref:GAR domain-containing protein n=1 Tax=Hyphodiscus hymeniophilus TaxID=353542 RepID=A0A9P6VI90_9HELO|nr:hypothetical protein D0Z07_5232 [Hyphodiscus hymeniophilus]